MQIQRVQKYNYKPQFNGTLSVKELEYRESVTKGVKSICKDDDKKLYDMFVEILGEEPAKWASFSGGVQSKLKFPKFVECVNELLGTKIPTLPKDRTDPLLYSYSTDGKGNITYELGYFKEPHTIIHTFNRGKKYIVTK